jgi:hypothetical protein
MRTTSVDGYNLLLIVPVNCMIRQSNINTVQVQVHIHSVQSGTTHMHMHKPMLPPCINMYTHIHTPHTHTLYLHAWLYMSTLHIPTHYTCTHGITYPHSTYPPTIPAHMALHIHTPHTHTLYTYAHRYVGMQCAIKWHTEVYRIRLRRHDVKPSYVNVFPTWQIQII